MDQKNAEPFRGDGKRAAGWGGGQLVRVETPRVPGKAPREEEREGRGGRQRPERW